MKTQFIVNAEIRRPRFIARFGRGSLVATGRRLYQLRGGSAEDRTEVKEWISLFAHEGILLNSAGGNL